VTLAGDGEELGFEEAVLTTLEIRHLTLRVGQMHAAFGRHNRLHTHAFPFLTAPQPWRVLLGPEGLVDPGLSAELLLPLPFYTEVTAQVFRGEWTPFEGGVPDDPTTPADEAVPDRRRDEDLGALGHLKTLFDLSDSSTIEVGGSWLGGRNGHGGWTHVVGADLTVKWRPVEAERYRGVDWTSELLWVSRGHAPAAEDTGALGAYSAVRAQLAQRFWLQVRGSVLEHRRGTRPERCAARRSSPSSRASSPRFACSTPWRGRGATGPSTRVSRRPSSRSAASVALVLTWKKDDP